MSIDRYNSILDAVANVSKLKKQLRDERRKLESMVTVSEAKERGPTVDVERFKVAADLTGLNVEERTLNYITLTVSDRESGLYASGKKEEIIGLLYKASMKND